MVAARDERRRPWWLALVALTLCSSWPGWEPSPIALAAVAAGLAVLARPQRREWWPWLGVAAAVVLGALQPSPTLRRELLEQQLCSHCEEMMTVAEEVAGDPTLRRLVAATGEALKPELPFTVLRRRLAGSGGRTLYLADDRGRLVAWAGETAAAYPQGARPLGQRLWGVAWSAGGGTLWVREPIFVEGRLVGAVTVADATPLEARRVWGMVAPFGCELMLGQGGDRLRVSAAGRPGVEVPVGCRVAPPEHELDLALLPWLMVAVPSVLLVPVVGATTVLLAGAALALAPGVLPSPVLGGLLLLGGLAAGRVASGLSRRWSRPLVVAVVATAAVASILGPLGLRAPWLPSHLVRPGWGGVWMVALAMVAAAWPHRDRSAPVSLGRLLAAAAALAGLALVVELVRLPVGLLEESRRARGVGRPAVVLPRSELELERLLPAPVATCSVDDLAPVLADRWGLDRWATPCELTLGDGEGRELSRWGDLTPAGDAVRPMRRWRLRGAQGWSLELAVAMEPWSWLGDWQSATRRVPVPQVPVWFAAMTRSGSVTATLHPEVLNLDPATAGDLWHAGAGWASMTISDAPQLARVWRQGDWLMAAVARSPAPSVWVVQAAVACLWALLGLVLARPPALRRQQLATFGGRLRLLLAAGVVLPLIILTLFLHLRLQREEQRLDQVAGLDALRAARYTAVSLAEGLAIDDSLARWLERLVGGEVVLFDGAEVKAVSRRDLLDLGALPDLPLAAVFPHFLLGRDDPVVQRKDGHLVAAGAVELEGRRYLLQVYPTLPLPPGEAPEAVDWLLTGAALAALAVLLLTSRVERRLSASLHDLVGLAGRLLDGRPLGTIRRPKETDLAEVLDAVRSMYEEVQRREQSLRHQEEMLRITLATLAPAVMVLEREGGRVRFANPSAELVLGAHRDRVLRLVHAMAERATEPDAPVVESVQPLPGEELTWRVGVAGVPLPDGGRGLVAVVDDVTDLVQADRLRQITQLARIVAHEVKNPLTPIRLWVQELEEARRRSDPDLDGILAEACREISAQVGRLQSTASSFSNLVALESWSPKPVDAVELVGDALGALAVLARRGITVHRELPPARSCQVVGDREWLRRALDNLIKNSVDALNGPGDLWVRVSCSDETVALEVEDSAGGVPERELENLFSPHFSTTTGGSGLGLALVHQVVARCHGRVAARNGPRGLVVRLELHRAADPPSDTGA